MGGCGSGRKGENGGRWRRWAAGKRPKMASGRRSCRYRTARTSSAFFRRLLGRRTGFSLCQTWNILCVALPDPITYASPFLDLRWVSLATSLCGTMVAALFRHRVSALLQRPTFLYAIGAVAALGSILGPLSALLSSNLEGAHLHCSRLRGSRVRLPVPLWFERFCRARDMMGLAISVVATALLTYPLANMLSSDQVSPWIAAAIASVLPLVSVALAHARPRQGNPADPSPAPAASIPPAGRRRAFRPLLRVRVRNRECHRKRAQPAARRDRPRVLRRRGEFGRTRVEARVLCVAACHFSTPTAPAASRWCTARRSSSCSASCCAYPTCWKGHGSSMPCWTSARFSSS